MQLEPTLASVRVVTSEHAEVEALCHVVQMLHEFVFPGYALVRAAEQGSFRLFTGALRFVDHSSSLSHFEKLQQYRLAMHVVPTKMMPKQDALAAMEQLYQRHPESLDNESVSAILEACDLPMLQWLHRCKGSKVFTNGHRTEMILFDNASTLGRMDVVQWFVRTFPEIVCDLSCAAREGYVDQLKWLVENAKWNQSSIGWAVSAAASSGDLETVKFLDAISTTPYKISNFYEPVEGCFEAVKWVHEHECGEDWRWILLKAAFHGDLEMVQWFHTNRPERFTEYVMDGAAEYGHLELVKWLHSNRQEGCTSDAMDRAAANGLLEVVQWLHINRTEGCKASAMDSAASSGHFHVLEWLYANRSEGFTPCAVNSAVRKNQLDILKWLHAHSGENYPRGNIDIPAANGNLEMVSWLHFTGSGVCSQRAMDRAAANGHINVVKFLHEHRKEGCSKDATNEAAAGNHLEILKYLCSTVGAKCSSVSVKAAAANGHLDTVKWLVEERSVQCQEVALIGAAKHGRLRVLRYLRASTRVSCTIKVMKAAMKAGQCDVVKWLYFHVGLPLYAGCELDAARCQNLGMLELIRTHSDLCKSPSIYHSASRLGNIEVALWYMHHFGHPCKKHKQS